MVSIPPFGPDMFLLDRSTSPEAETGAFNFHRVLKSKHQAVSQGVRRIGKRSLFGHM